MAKQTLLKASSRDPHQVQQLLAMQALELRGLRDKYNATVNNLAITQLLLAHLIGQWYGENPLELDLTEVQTALVNKQINFKQLDNTHIQIYLTDKPVPESTGDKPSDTQNSVP